MLVQLKHQNLEQESRFKTFAGGSGSLSGHKFFICRETESHYRQTRRSSVWKWLRQTISRVGLSMTSWGLQVWGLRPTTLRGHWLYDSLSCQRTGSGLKQMLSGELLVHSVL